MAELSGSFKQLDTVGKLRYKEMLGMLWVTQTRALLQEMFGTTTLLVGLTCHVNFDSANSAIGA